LALSTAVLIMTFMSEREGILSAVLEDPADDMPRMVYADWLDDHDSPDRAEFIRSQIRLVRQGRKLPREERQALKARIDSLLWTHHIDWVRMPYPFLHKWGVKRGFISWASIPGPNGQPPSPTEVQKLLSNEPIEKIVLRAWDAAGARRLFGWLGCTPPPSLRTVWITLPGLRMADADLLFTSALTTGRREMRLNRCAMAARTLQRLQSQARLHGLEVRMEGGYKIVKARPA
jgi:uncharacterized protein (TIGR02996 family)